MTLLYNNVTILPTVLLAYYSMVGMIPFWCPEDINLHYHELQTEECHQAPSKLCVSYSFGLFNLWSPPKYYENAKKITLEARVTTENGTRFISLHLETCYSEGILTLRTV